MAAIVIGGLLSSAVLNLLIMPAIMLHFGRFDAPSRRFAHGVIAGRYLSYSVQTPSQSSDGGVTA